MGSWWNACSPTTYYHPRSNFAACRPRHATVITLHALEQPATTATHSERWWGTHAQTRINAHASCNAQHYTWCARGVRDFDGEMLRHGPPWPHWSGMPWISVGAAVLLCVG